MCQGLGPKKHDEISETDRNPAKETPREMDEADGPMSTANWLATYTTTTTNNNNNNNDNNNNNNDNDNNNNNNNNKYDNSNNDNYYYC